MLHDGQFDRKVYFEVSLKGKILFESLFKTEAEGFVKTYFERTGEIASIDQVWRS